MLAQHTTRPRLAASAITRLYLFPSSREKLATFSPQIVTPTAYGKLASGSEARVAITQQSPQRLVDRLQYVTSAGARVTTLVTDLGVYEKRDDRFVLTRWFPLEGRDPQSAVEFIRSRCGWALQVAADIAPVPPPAADELARLRLYDTRNDFLTHTAAERNSS